MHSGWSYIRDSGDFIDKMKRIGKVPDSSFLVTADVVGLYPNIPHKEGILALKRKLEELTSSKIPTNDLVKLAEFVIWTHGEAEHKKFMEELHNFLPNLEFTYKSSKKRVAFLDLNVSLENGSVTTDLHTKSTDSHHYLHCSSSHPHHIKKLHHL